MHHDQIVVFSILIFYAHWNAIIYNALEDVGCAPVSITKQTRGDFSKIVLKAQEKISWVKEFNRQRI